MSNEQNREFLVPPGAQVLIINAEASGTVVRADGTIKED